MGNPTDLWRTENVIFGLHIINDYVIIKVSKGKPVDRTPKGVHPRREIVSLFFISIMKKQLSIFVDESGNVGFNSEGASNFYIVCMVFHDQKDDISEQLKKIFNSHQW